MDFFFFFAGKIGLIPKCENENFYHGIEINNKDKENNRNNEKNNEKENFYTNNSEIRKHTGNDKRH